MSYSFSVSKSDVLNKKYKVIIYENGVKRKTINFGDNRYKDFIQYHRINPALANERKKLYIQRHKKREDFTDFFTAGYWSRAVLWNLPTLEASIRSINLNK